MDFGNLKALKDQQSGDGQCEDDLHQSVRSQAVDALKVGTFSFQGD